VSEENGSARGAASGMITPYETGATGDPVYLINETRRGVIWHHARSQH
jgi:hypothetical protein